MLVILYILIYKFFVAQSAAQTSNGADKQRQTSPTSIPSVCMPTLSSGCSLIPLSMMSAMFFKAGAKSFSR